MKDPFHLRHVKGCRGTLSRNVGDDQRCLMIIDPQRVVVVTANLISRFGKCSDVEVGILLKYLREQTLLNSFCDF
jgi:hypothetical protein